MSKRASKPVVERLNKAIAKAPDRRVTLDLNPPPLFVDKSSYSSDTYLRVFDKEMKELLESDTAPVAWVRAGELIAELLTWGWLHNYEPMFVLAAAAEKFRSITALSTQGILFESVDMCYGADRSPSAMPEVLVPTINPIRSRP